MDETEKVKNIIDLVKSKVSKGLLKEAFDDVNQVIN